MVVSKILQDVLGFCSASQDFIGDALWRDGSTLVAALYLIKGSARWWQQAALYLIRGRHALAAAADSCIYRNMDPLLRTCSKAVFDSVRFCPEIERFQ